MLMVLILNILVSGADGFPHLNWKKNVLLTYTFA